MINVYEIRVFLLHNNLGAINMCGTYPDDHVFNVAVQHTK